MATFREEGFRPSDRRGFVHGRIGRGVTGFISSGFNPLGALSGLASGGSPGSRTEKRGFFTGGLKRRLGAPRPVDVIPRTFEPAVTVASVIPGDVLGTIGDIFGIGGGDDNGRNGRTGPCEDPRLRRDARGNCIFPGSPRGADVFRGEAINGRFGAGTVAGSRIVDVAVCPSGAVLGKDGICYDHLPNRDRLYPRGRRPLLTGGDMGAISRASRAGKKLDRTNARLRGLGFMKPAAVRKRRPKKVC